MRRRRRVRRFVIVLRASQAPFDLAAADEAELADRIECAARGEVESAETLFARIRAHA
jgi:hypothetical protein